MQNLQTVDGHFKAAPRADQTFPLDGFHRVAAKLVLDSVAFDDLTEWEQKFAADIAASAYQTINEKQWGVLARLIAAAARIERRRAGGAA